MKKEELKRIPEMAKVLTEVREKHRIVLVYKDRYPCIEDVKHNKLLSRVAQLAKRQKCCIFVDDKLILLGENFMNAEALLKREDLITEEGIRFLPSTTK